MNIKLTFRLLVLLLSLSIGCTASAQVQAIIDSIRSVKAPDRRVAIWELSTKDDNGVYIISGNVDNQNNKDEIINTLTNKGYTIKDQIKVLPYNIDKPWALACLPVVHLRTKPGHEQELTSQALMGTPLRILEKVDDWYRVQTPDNYIAYVTNSSIKRITQTEFNDWRKSANRYVVTALRSNIYSQPNIASDIVSNILLGDILDSGEKSGNMIKLSTPDGRSGYALITDVEPLSKWVNQVFSPEKIISTAKQLMGSVYLWGGTSPLGVDCSGLTKTCYFANGVILQRDASQQVLYGQKINPKDWKLAKKGDLLYFGEKSGKVTHTAIYIADGKYIHSSGRVKINSVNPLESDYLTTPFLSINRINGNVDSKGITSVKNHSWYFIK